MVIQDFNCITYNYMNIINFDGAKTDKQIKHHFLLPDCHYIIIGPTGTGKTNLLCNMLLRWMNFDNVIIYTINSNQDKYRFLTEFNELFDKNVIQILSPEDTIPVEELEDEIGKIIVFDDIKIDDKHMSPIKEYFSLSRNKNCNCIYLAQSYYDVPKYIRRNTGCFVLFNGLDNRDIQTICNDQCKRINKDQFLECYHLATNDRHDFMVFYKDAENVPEMYRKGFDQFFLPQV